MCVAARSTATSSRAPDLRSRTSTVPSARPRPTVTIVGTPMMRLGAGVFPLRLDRTGITLQYSAEPVYDVHDRARSLLEPDVLVPPGHDILAAGVLALEAARHGSP